MQSFHMYRIALPDAPLDCFSFSRFRLHPLQIARTGSLVLERVPARACAVLTDRIVTVSKTFASHLSPQEYDRYMPS